MCRITHKEFIDTSYSSGGRNKSYWKCLICDETFHQSRFTHHLKHSHDTTPEGYYFSVVESWDCPVCGKETNYHNLQSGQSTYCSRSCGAVNQHKEISEDPELLEQRRLNCSAAGKSAWECKSDEEKELETIRLRQAFTDYWSNITQEQLATHSEISRDTMQATHEAINLDPERAQQRSEWCRAGAATVWGSLANRKSIKDGLFNSLIENVTSDEGILYVVKIDGWYKYGITVQQLIHRYKGFSFEVEREILCPITKLREWEHQLDTLDLGVNGSEWFTYNSLAAVLNVVDNLNN